MQSRGKPAPTPDIELGVGAGLPRDFLLNTLPLLEPGITEALPRNPMDLTSPVSRRGQWVRTTAGLFIGGNT